MQAPSYTEQVFHANGIPIAAKCWGNPAHPPILALHGWLDNCASFDTLAPLLAERFYVTAVDLWGHGRSGHRTGGDYTTHSLIDYVALVEELRRYLGWQKLTLLGHSMGAAIGVLWAGTYPEICEQLILIEGIGPLTANASELPARLRQGIEECLRFSSKVAPRYPDVAAAAMARVRASDLPYLAAITLAERGTKSLPSESSSQSSGVTWSTDPRLKLPSLWRMNEEQVIAFLSAIVAPVLLITGDAGLKLEKSVLERRIAAIRILVHHEIAGGHHVHMEKPREVAEFILNC